jgi:hypothetical protein
VLGIHISKERNMLVTEKFIRSLVANMENIQFTLMEEGHGIQKHRMY